MQVTHTRVAVTAAEERGQPPAEIIAREVGEANWVVAFAPLIGESGPDWRLVRKQDRVYIPLFPYLVQNRPADAFGFLLQLGAFAAASALTNGKGQTIQRMHLVLGEPVMQVQVSGEPEARWRFYAGVGFAVR